MGTRRFAPYLFAVTVAGTLAYLVDRDVRNKIPRNNESNQSFEQPDNYDPIEAFVRRSASYARLHSG